MSFVVPSENPLVLVADDDMAIRFLLREALEQEGFVVEEVGDGSQVLSAFRKLKPDLVMLDVLMPGMDGFAVCSEIRSLSEGNRVPIIMMTGLDDLESIRNAYSAGATDFITKPINWSLISYRVHYVLRSSRTLESLKLNEARLAEAQKVAKIGTWEVDMVTGDAYWSEQVFKIFGLVARAGRVSHQLFMNAVHSLDREPVDTLIRSAFTERKSLCFECRIVTPDGEERTIHAETYLDLAGQSGRDVVLGYIQDITDRKNTEEKIRRLAYYDNLTGLPNRILFKENYHRALALSKRTNDMMAILFIDLDRFKQINDSLGHYVGDELLKDVAGRLTATIRKYDYVIRDNAANQEITLARFGGDEFLLLLEKVRDHNDVAKIAQRIGDCLSAPYTVQGTEIIITASIGISMCPSDGESLEDLIKFADIAMYYAKELGRNNFQFYAQCVNKDVRNHLVLESQLRKAIINDELLVCYQPIIDVASRKITGVEALVRWQHPDLGILSPAKFITLAEETGLITDIDEWVLNNACRQVTSWHDGGLTPFILSVNISVRHFKKKTLTETIHRVLRETHIEPRFLKLEITESVLMEKDVYTVSTINSLKKMGIKFAVDDFGTGYSSFSYLKRFPLDILKIDRSFVKDIPGDPDSESITSAIIAMSEALKIDTIAEGVETTEQLEWLMKKGCRKMQGNYFSKPLMAIEFEEYAKHFQHGGKSPEEGVACSGPDLFLEMFQN